MFGRLYLFYSQKFINFFSCLGTLYIVICWHAGESLEKTVPFFSFLKLFYFYKVENFHVHYEGQLLNLLDIPEASHCTSSHTWPLQKYQSSG